MNSLLSVGVDGPALRAQREGRDTRSSGDEKRGGQVSEEDVKRTGKMVRVTLGGVSAERTYATVAHAKRAYLTLMFSKKARLRFFRPTPRRDN